MPSSSWKGYISFGLISVPIRLYAAARASHVGNGASFLFFK